MTGIERFVAAARAAFASVDLGEVARGKFEEQAGVAYGCTDSDGYVKECGAGEEPRWFMADRVSQGVTIAQQITSPETPGVVYPLCQWEIVREIDRDTPVPTSIELTYRVVALADSHEYYAPGLVEAGAAVSLCFVEDELPASVSARSEFRAGAFRTLTAADLDRLILRNIWKERRELLSYREGPVIGEEGQVLAYFEAVRTLSLWS